MDIIKTGSTWVLRTAPVLDITGVRLTGLTDIKFSVSRYTGGAWQWLDTADMTFRASPAGYQFTMTAVDATKVAGVYHYVIDWTTVTNVSFGDQLFFDVQQVTLTNASNPNQSSETTYGSIIDKVEANLTVATSTLATPTNITAGTITTVTNVTNAPTNGDLTATMKASVTAAVPTAVAISDVVRAGIIIDHGDGSYLAVSLAGLALESTLTAIKGATFDSATDSLEALRNRGDSAWITANISGLATSTNVTDARDHIEAYGQINWVTATGFATVGAAMTLSDGALLPAKIGAGFVAAMQLNLALEATLTSMKGATFDGSTDSLEALRNRGDAAWLTGSGWAVAGDAMTLTAPALTAVQAKIIDDATPFHGASIATILAFGAPPNAAANAAAVWATVEGGSVGDMRYALTMLRERQTGRRKMGLDGYELIYGSDNVTVIARVLVKDIDGNVVVPAAGDPSEVSQEVAP